MVSIRLQRIGKKHQPSYRLVVAERRSKLGAPPREDLGSYNPFTKAAAFKQDRVTYWLGVGARPTVTAHNLLVKTGILSSPKRRVLMPKAEVKAAEEQTQTPEEQVSEEKPAAEASEGTTEAAPTE